ncbi:MAG: hypothetical protein HKN43_06325 [Rhodothermales bacterium]|nr:hypothetical protein [Rhodothermales bacterium]
MNRYFSTLVIATISLTLASCDSSGPDNAGGNTFSVRYEATGTCDGIIGANMVSVGYTVDGGGSEGKTVATPWSETFSIDSSTVVGGVGLTAICIGSGAVANTVTVEIFVDGVSKATATETSTGTITINANAALN